MKRNILSWNTDAATIHSSEKFNVWMLSDTQVKPEYWIKISNSFAILKNPEEITESSETNKK